MNKLIYSILLTAVLTSSLHSMSTLKKFLTSYESYEAIPEGKYRTCSIASNFEGASPLEAILNNFNWEKTTGKKKLAQTAYTQFTIFTGQDRSRLGEYDTYEKMMDHHSSGASEQSFFLRLTREHDVQDVYNIPAPLILLCNKNGELINPSFRTNKSSDGTAEFVTKKEHRDAQYNKKVYEQGIEYRWTRTTIYNPGVATVGKYAAIAGSVWLGYKLYKKIFGKTEKPAPAKGAAKGKRVAVRAVS